MIGSSMSYVAGTVFSTNEFSYLQQMHVPSSSHVFLVHFRSLALSHVSSFKSEHLDKGVNDVAMVISGQTISQCGVCTKVRKAVMKLCR